MDGVNVDEDQKYVFEVGTVMSDGSVYAGISPETGMPLFTALKDAASPMTWMEAIDYAAVVLCVNRHNGWRLPTLAELDLLYANREIIGNFHTSGEHHEGWYWSADEDFGECVWMRHFGTGSYHLDTKDGRHRVRCVRP